MKKFLYDDITEADAIIRADSEDDGMPNDAEFCGYDDESLAIYRSETGFPW